MFAIFQHRLVPYSFLLVSMLCSAQAAAQARFVDPSTDIEAVFALLGERLAIMPDVAAWKWAHQAAILDPAREQSVLEQTRQKAQALGIDVASASALLTLQMRLARDLQTASFARWQAAGFDVRDVPDLNAALRPRLDRLGDALLRAVAIALPQLARADFRTRYAARAQALQKAAGLAQDDGQALLDALAAVRAIEGTRALRIRATKLLRVGMTGDYAPFSVEVDGQLRGVDVALAEAFARSIGAHVEFVKTSWSTLMRDYGEDAFDIALSGISITPERAAQARFSVPYRSSGKTPIARCRERTKFATLSAIDRPEVRVIVNPGGTNEAFARAELKTAQLTVFPDNRTIFDELVAGRADVMITDDVEAELQHRRHRELCRTTARTFTQADKAWLVQSDSTLVGLVNGWLAPRVKDGTVARSITQALTRF